MTKKRYTRKTKKNKNKTQSGGFNPALAGTLAIGLLGGLPLLMTHKALSK